MRYKIKTTSTYYPARTWWDGRKARYLERFGGNVQRIIRGVHTFPPLRLRQKST